MRMQALDMSARPATIACGPQHWASLLAKAVTVQCLPEKESAACCDRYICARMRLQATPCIKASIVTNPTGFGSAACHDIVCQCRGHLTGHEREGAAVEALERSQQPLIKRACAQRDVVRDVSPSIRRLSRRERTHRL